MMNTRENNIKRFEELMSKIKRPGSDKLLRYIQKETDFYTAPASTKYHLSCVGGLLQHSLNVYDCMMEKKDTPTGSKIFSTVTDENIIVMSLLHDLCKVNYYTLTTKTGKITDAEIIAKAAPSQIRHDESGDFIWGPVETYTIDDSFPLGHAEKSIMLINYYMQLKNPEIYAIRWHMGYTTDWQINAAINKAIKMYPIVWALMQADSEASKLIETPTGNKLSLIA